MSQDKKTTPQGGEPLMTEEMKAQLALLQRAKSLGILGDLTASIEKAEADAAVTRTKGAVQKAVHALTITLKDESITNSRLAIDWDMEGKITFRYGPKRKGSGGSGTAANRVPVHDGIVYESTAKMADAFGGVTPGYEWGAATWLKRSKKVEFTWLDKDAAKSALEDGQLALAEGNSIE